jgi:hypothetical protein
VARLSSSRSGHSSVVADSEEAHSPITTRDLPAQVTANDANSVLNFILVRIAFEKSARVDNTWLETMAQTLREELRISCTVVDIVVVDQDSEKLQTLEDAPWRLLVENMEWQYIDRCSTYVEELPFTRHDPTRWSCFIGGSQMWRQRTCACRLCHEYSAIPGSALVACHENGCL